MDSSPLLIGVDVGTTGCKALAVSADGRAEGRGYAGYGMQSFPGGRVEQDPADWVRGLTDAVNQALAGLDRSRVAALALSTQGASSLLTDRGGKPLTPALTWMDTRAAGEARAIAAEMGGETVYHISGWRAHGALDMAKARWLAEHEPGLWRQAACFETTVEYGNRWLTGEPAIDPTNAAIRQLLDIGTRRWSPALLQAARLEEGRLAPLKPAGAALGPLTQEAARALGLPPAVQVYNGAHDQYCGALGAGLVEPGQMMLSAGTAWVALAVTGEPVWSPHYISPGPHVVPGRYGALASLPCGGAALDWLCRQVTGGGYDEIDSAAPARRENGRDLFFFPHLAGAGFPDWDERAKGAFIGLTLPQDGLDMALACMEGVAFEWRRALDAFTDSGIAADSLRVMGGATGSPAWLSAVAALWGGPVMVLGKQDTACRGAAMIAAVGMGLYKDFHAAARALAAPAEAFVPQPSLIEYYRDKYRRYLAMAPHIRALNQQE